jgi:hypothetical protein
MLKTLTGVALAGVLAVGAVTASSQQAEARCYGCAVGAGVVGGLAAGAIIGSALAYPRYGYGYYGGPAYGYAPAYYGGYGGYYGGPAYYGRSCWTRRVVGPNGGVRRVRVCR